jgi:mevalonate kinase
MKWFIPAKTFLLGEYAAITGASAIILTTSPCFELSLSDKTGLHGIHPDSPAGRWWAACGHQDAGLLWHDPYQGRGGMGASSAQFLGTYLASMYLQKKVANQQDLLDAYVQSAWFGQGLRPSGYDVLAQSRQGCVYINRQKALYQSYSWPFPDIAFLLVHTGTKLATHHHLQTMSLPSEIKQLVYIVDKAQQAFEYADQALIVDMVNAYHQQLAKMNLVAEHSMEHITFFREQADVLAVKGCGAMGSDVLLLLVPTKNQAAVSCRLSAMGLNIVATNADLHTEQSLGSLA